MQRVWHRKDIQKKWTLKSAMDVSFLQIARMKLPELAEYAQFMQNQLKLRVRSYSRAKAYNHPFAYEKLMRDFKELNEKAGYEFDFNSSIVNSAGRTRFLSDTYAALNNPIAKLRSYVVQLQDFFEAKSSTVSGWRDIIRNESMKLFGYKEYNTKNGTRIRLNYLMSEREREAFWKLYEELKKSAKVAIYDSESMRSTGFTRIWRTLQAKGEWNYDDLTSMMNRMLEEMRNSGVPVRDIPEHVPRKKSDPFPQDQGEEEDFEEFQW